MKKKWRNTQTEIEEEVIKDKKENWDKQIKPKQEE